MPGQHLLPLAILLARRPEAHAVIEAPRRRVLPMHQQQHPAAARRGGEDAQRAGQQQTADAAALGLRRHGQVAEPPGRAVVGVRMGDVEADRPPLPLSQDEHMRGAAADDALHQFEGAEETRHRPGIEGDARKDASLGAADAAVLEGSPAPNGCHGNLA